MSHSFSQGLPRCFGNGTFGSILAQIFNGQISHLGIKKGSKNENLGNFVWFENIFHWERVLLHNLVSINVCLTMLQCIFCFCFRRKDEIYVKVDDSYKHFDGDNQGKNNSLVVLLLKCLVQSVPITTKVLRLNPVHGEVYLIQLYVIKFVSDLRLVGSFIQVLRYPIYKNIYLIHIFLLILSPN